MREIVLDTETTGLDPTDGHRLVEIGCIELINHLCTGKTYHQYINPERDMPAGAFDVHGLSESFLSGFPVFPEIANTFIEFIGEDPLIIHNAKFDLGFLNAELKRAGKPIIPGSQTVDTVLMARRVFPGAPASLDALCRRYGIDNSARTNHGALLDAELLADVYLELRGGREPDLTFAPTESEGLPQTGESHRLRTIQRVARPPRAHSLTPEEHSAHKSFIETLNKPLWNKL
ncbi:MAG: DNA polymerase III subunit epsilon [Pseudomonadota bacterium]|nr:DNA polymerase III subunit epsilon [Pseudomonadota bacterium]